ncbi:3-hydroxyacyl-CoA dehydrogenase NAD-binding domain-containing protein [Glaciecola petra]|uniref:3-hydroxyacyl-CoA dehydrogenase NAD-binding domain-containing protein n=1 Tax=Glaciecola petra TaxID=3075602 RepID=A0ABU2ZWS2_9ALTE|nr:3-hydroxyacyl-CoA dehydrogenase NAD-binding domain-containing protein [Aestuariibacter sp. P117]MDT0596468.1 3-hydroxyacyl-CoA dehydrogenase NAD-binding domain-containing protein [Aestuariibacter sp. P117]
MSIFNLSVDANGIAIITWDVPGATMNVMSSAGYEELSIHIETVLTDDSIKGAVITSGKKDFAGGMDLNELGAMKANAGKENPASTIFQSVMNGHQILRRIERAGMDKKTNEGGKPIVSALPGTAAGIGIELALSTHRVFVSDRKGAKYGLPESLVGIFPGGGGTVRMLFRVGLVNAMQLLSQGKMLDAQKALNAGYVDEVVPHEELLTRAKQWILTASNEDIVKPWDKKGFKLPGGGAYHPAGMMNFLGSTAIVHHSTKGVYQNQSALLSVMYESSMVDFDTAIEIEARWFTKVLLNPSSEAMIRSLFLNKQALEKGANRPKEIPDMSVKKLGILGAGLMGAGIAQVSAKAGIEVVLLDRDQESAEKGKAYSANILDKAIAKGRSTSSKKEALLALIKPTANYEDLSGCDLIVEAVFEDKGVKAEATKQAEAQMTTDAVFASNTSTLPISELARASKNAERFIGIHFFSPVERMALVEIIKGEKTGDHAVAKALDFVRQIGKTPIVVNDARYFYANRCIIPYANEGVKMLKEGVNPHLIENAAKQLGMPLGPLQLNDETAIDLAYRIMTATKADLGDEYEPTGTEEVVEFLYNAGRFGKKTKAGFYEYDSNGKRQQIWKGLNKQFPLLEVQPSFEEIKDRLALSQSFEAVRALEEGVLEDIREGDVGAILGWGFMPWSGGPFGYLDIVGADNAVAKGNDLAIKYGKQFKPPKKLLEHSQLGTTFY